MMTGIASRTVPESKLFSTFSFKSWQAYFVYKSILQGSIQNSILNMVLHAAYMLPSKVWDKNYEVETIV